MVVYIKVFGDWLWCDDELLECVMVVFEILDIVIFIFCVLFGVWFDY